MNCFCCNSPLGEEDICKTCGQDVILYKRVIKNSNFYYNLGLERAKIRDLSGAVPYLKKAVSFNKKNTDARNLLGLIYFEMGEMADALAEWVISKNFQPENNRAQKYLDIVQAHKGRMEQYDSSVQKFKQALYYVGHDGGELALLQTRKVINMNPKYVKAYLFLALLYIQKKEYVKAEKALKRVVAIDVNNSTALKYLSELEGKTEKKVLFVRKAKSKKQEEDIFNDYKKDRAIIPTYTEKSDSWQAVVLLLAGILVGALFFNYLLMPSQKHALKTSFHASVNEYNEKLSAKNMEINTLNDQIASLKEEKAGVESELSAYNAEGGIITEYNDLLNVLVTYAAGDYLGALNLMTEVNPELVSDETFKNTYNNLKNEFDTNGPMVLYSRGYEAYEARDYETAKNYLTKCVELQPDFPDALFWLGLSHQNLGDKATADTYYTQIIDNYPGTAYAVQAQQLRGY